MFVSFSRAHVLSTITISHIHEPCNYFGDITLISYLKNVYASLRQRSDCMFYINMENQKRG